MTHAQTQATAILTALGIAHARSKDAADLVDVYAQADRIGGLMEHEIGDGVALHRDAFAEVAEAIASFTEADQHTIALTVSTFFGYLSTFSTGRLNCSQFGTSEAAREWNAGIRLLATLSSRASIRCLKLAQIRLDALIAEYNAIHGRELGA